MGEGKGEKAVGLQCGRVKVRGRKWRATDRDGVVADGWWEESGGDEGGDVSDG